ncbi:MAG: putative deoxyuridine 5'-triphosphate nucleotidohydrolase [Prokaryotic dsDNA virus sp.]|nr:MAG: putative deoxyuridine 5'-triphosphate nucleotidohydrolase [Prokaryotic dsDNA virus sp.]|tara:strand:- start:2604 stop:3074 length:471 start_codon:yes stop_codon:yes gene_type:complete
MNLKVYRLREDAKLPLRAHATDAGMDLFYCPNGEKKLYDCTRSYYIPPRESRLLPTGIKVEVPYGHMLEIKNKSGIASKRQLITGACVVDPGYDGEVFVNLHNIGIVTQKIRAGEKIAQAVLIPILHCGIEEVGDPERLNRGSTRGEGGFGSTGIL